MKGITGFKRDNLSFVEAVTNKGVPNPILGEDVPCLFNFDSLS